VSNTSTLPILCLEDDRYFSHMLLRGLGEREVELVDRAAISREKIHERAYGAWLLEVNVPDGSGLDVLAWARARGDRTPALVMTGRSDHAAANRAQELGAEFLYKPYPKSCLDAFLLRCDAAHARHASIAGAVARLTLRYALPRREQDIVSALARGVARTELAEALDVSENTVKSTVRKLLGRTEHANLDELLRSLLRFEH
jgi:DNA-binding NarL/FixJ family response regulator